MGLEKVGSTAFVMSRSLGAKNNNLLGVFIRKEKVLMQKEWAHCRVWIWNYPREIAREVHFSEFVQFIEGYKKEEVGLVGEGKREVGLRLKKQDEEGKHRGGAPSAFCGADEVF